MALLEQIQSGRLWLLQTCVCSMFTAYISVTIGLILIKLGGGVGTWVQLNILEFHKPGGKEKSPTTWN